MKKLVTILEEEDLLSTLNLKEDLLITGVTDKAQEVRPGYLFVARRGTKQHGEAFIPLAIERGAVAILRETPPEDIYKVAQVQVKDPLRSGSRILLKFLDNPERDLNLLGVTGTNGKSSVSFFLKELLNCLGYPTGYIGTLFYEVGSIAEALETTPSIFRLAPLLKRARDLSLAFIVMEVSSHALDQDRIFGLKFKVSAFTNLSRDHLDYHGDMENYYLSKKKLFTHYLEDRGKAVISYESDYGRRLAGELLKDGFLSEGDLLVVNNGDINAEIIDRTPGLKLQIRVYDSIYQVETKLFGDYQAKNVATLLGCALALELELEEVLEALRHLSNPPGRLELCGKKGEALIFVDYAHTPEALENAIRGLLPLKRERLIVLFGCGGNRDPGKRPLMGEVAQRLSDIIILTSDNPRFEDPVKIIDDIKGGMNGSKPCFCIPDRREALAFAIEMLRDGDILLVAGKGHERYQEIEGTRYPFSDQEEIKKILRSSGVT